MSRTPASMHPHRWPRLQGWLREPLIQLLLVGFLLFAAHHALNPTPDSHANSRRIVLTEDDLRQLTLAWLAQGRPQPTPVQLQSLVEHRVREEVFYREALALGLDQGDTIVRRRLAQKMRFLSEDIQAVYEPTREELQAWFKKNATRFISPVRVSFRHLYFSTDRRGHRARDDAALALDALDSALGNPSVIRVPSDAFMFQSSFANRSIERVATLFGGPFANALLELPTGFWQGPVESAYGWHLARVDSIAGGDVLSFDSVESEVRAAWIDEQRGAAQQRSYETLRARYQIIVPESENVSALAASP